MRQSLKDKKSYTIIDYYESYLTNIASSKLYTVKYSVFRSILVDYFKFLSEEIIDNSKEVRIPGRMGLVYIEKRKPIKYERSRLHVDFKATKESDKTILHFNEHSNGYSYRFHWDKTNMLVGFYKAYEMVFTRRNKRYLASLIKENKKDYIEK